MKQQHSQPVVIAVILFTILVNDVNAQNVGIGILVPTSKLQVEQTTSSDVSVGRFKLNTTAPGGRAITGEVSGNGSTVLYGVMGTSSNIGSSATSIGVKGDSYGSNPGEKIGIEGHSIATNGLGFGTRGQSFGNNPAGTNYGIYGTAYNGGTNWAGYFQDGNVYMANNLGIGNYTPAYKLDVRSNAVYAGNFNNNSTDLHYIGLNATCNNSPGFGYGLRGSGGYAGVYGEATLPGVATRIGVQGYGKSGTNENYGLYGAGEMGNIAYGVYGEARNAAISYGVYGTTFGLGTQYAGYFNGNVYSTGTYLPSDKKLKNEIQSIDGALSIINQLNPTVYKYKTEEFSQMNLPEGLRYGLIADEVKQVLPGLVKKAVQPASYENNDYKKGKKISEAVEFNTVNYMELIPILIGAVKEQNQVIRELKKEIELLKNKAGN